jgi:hypothetical protein
MLIDLTGGVTQHISFRLDCRQHNVIEPWPIEVEERTAEKGTSFLVCLWKVIPQTSRLL